MSKVLTIARYTMYELLKSRILYVTLVIGVGLAISVFVATEFTYGVPEKVALDFGLGMLSLSCQGISIFMGATLLTTELDSRTVYMLLSRPVPRWAFIAGKVLGLLTVLGINVLLLSGIMLACTLLLGGELTQVTLMAIIFNILESSLLLLLVVLFSLFANSILASISALTLLILGHAVKETSTLVFVSNKPFLKIILDSYHYIFPGFYKFNLKDYVLYEQKLATEFYLSVFGYGICYSFALFFLVLYLFNRKNLD